MMKWFSKPLSELITLTALSITVLGFSFALNDTHKAITEAATAEVAVEELDLSVLERIVSSTIQITCPDGDHGGSGVLFKHDGEWYAWTAAHVITTPLNYGLELADLRIHARLFDQGRLDLRVDGLVEKVIVVDLGMDLAIIKLTLPDFPFPALVFNDETLVLGQEVIHCGNHFVSVVPWFVSRGRVAQVPGESSLFQLRKGQYIGVNIAENPGCSGGGLWNLKGELVGILSSGAGSNVAAFVHNDTMIDFAAKHGTPWAIIPQ